MFLPCCPQVDFIVDLLRMALDENRTNLGIPRRVAKAGEASYFFVLNLSPLRFEHLPCCPQLDFIVDLCRMALDENPH